MQISAKSILKDVTNFINNYRIHNQLPKNNGYHRASRITDAQVITILILYQFSGYKAFKYFYFDFALKALRNIPSYSWFIRRQRTCIHLMLAYLASKKGKQTGIYFIDSTPVKVCKNQRINKHKTFKGIAARGHHSMGWFFGFKLHLIINEQGEIMDIYFTKGNKHDQIGLEKMGKELQGLLIGDKGYISQKDKEKLLKRHLKLITKVRSNMKHQKLTSKEKYYLYRRGIIETVIGSLKYIFQIENPRYRSVWNFIQNILAALTAYTLKPYKPLICPYFKLLSRN